MDIQAQLKLAIAEAINSLFNVPVETVILQPTKKEFEGLYTFVTFPLTKTTRKPPVEIGQAIGTYLKENTTIISQFNVVQGFLNLTIADSVWVEELSAMLANPTWGQLPSRNESVMVEFSSPNTNKPLHLGHLRNNFLGDSVSRILKANGYEVVKACLVNDRGIHICKSMLAYQEFGNGETPESTGMKGDHLIGKYYVWFDKAHKQQIEELIEEGMPREEAEKKTPLLLKVQEMLRKWEQGDPETVALWKQMNAWVYAGFAETYHEIGVSFDKTYYESETYLLGKDVIEDGLRQHVFYRKPDGSVWIDLADEGLDQKLVLRSDGTSVYITQDLGTTDLKFQDYPVQRGIWVVGNEQDYHFAVLFAILRRLGRPYADGLFHLSYGMVDLPSGKMKSREGTVVDADDLIEEMVETARNRTRELGKIDDFESEEATNLYHMLAMGALKYYLLKVDPKKRMTFNPEESIDFQGHTGPFIQYTHARICSVLRKAAQLGIDPAGSLKTVELADSEQQLVYLLTQFYQRITEAGTDYAPSYLGQYAFELAKAYNQFYGELSILSEPDADKLKFRVALSKAVVETICKTMELLGIEVPTKM
ncbi:arginine--tRNA ligase [Larkinella humicola]|uniref:Arginine--tRNA ligase n=1 Tax=Larkinella humicola TaxID=2607654 RepID=A0A5N1JIR9_9BACT|nr:arginine--tRNA ligase [Larkinella humicola]KAA9355062.1 arginine--tRNA ligase [Larkinella humicola]